MRTARLVALVALAATAIPAHAQDEVKPSAADPRVRNYDSPNLVFAEAPATAPLVIYMTGTGGDSSRPPRALLRTIAQQGYRVVFLTYDDDPAVSQVCPRRPPECSARFRATRAFGEANGGPVQNPREEAIVPRLTMLLRYLAKTRPDQGWAGYLAADGQPVWNRIVLSGLSQGAGMAAFIAKKFAVQRVVLFSSPWDETGSDRRPAPWLSTASATQPDRWWAERHAKEKTTELIAHAYQALAIPADHILVFDGPPSPNAHGPNPYHPSTVSLAQYAPQWRTMFGSPR